MPIDLKAHRGKTRKNTTRNIKILAATNYAIFVNNDLDEIARVVNVKADTLLYWANRSRKKEWAAACAYWKPNTLPVILHEKPLLAKQLRNCLKSLKHAEELWRYMIENGLDLFPSEIGTHEDLTHVLRNTTAPCFEPTGTEAITPLSRLRDYFMTARYRVKALLWKLYIAFCI